MYCKVFENLVCKCFTYHPWLLYYLFWGRPLYLHLKQGPLLYLRLFLVLTKALPTMLLRGGPRGRVPPSIALRLRTGQSGIPWSNRELLLARVVYAPFLSDPTPGLLTSSSYSCSAPVFSPLFAAFLPPFSVSFEILYWHIGLGPSSSTDHSAGLMALVDLILLLSSVAQAASYERAVVPRLHLPSCQSQWNGTKSRPT